AELERAGTTLPQQAADGGVSKGAAQALLARAAIFKGDFQLAATLTEEIMASGIYALVGNASQIFNSGSREIIWDHSAEMRADIRQFFYNRSVLPIIRYTEVVYMNAEAMSLVGRLAEAGQAYNILAARRGLAPINAVDVSSFGNLLQTLWR